MVNVQTRARDRGGCGARECAQAEGGARRAAEARACAEQLSTENYNVYPEMQYDRRPERRRSSAYVVTNTVRAEIKRPEQAGAIDRCGARRGREHDQSPQLLRVVDRRGASRGDRARGCERTSDAEAMARAAGGTLGALIELSTEWSDHCRLGRCTTWPHGAQGGEAPIDAGESRRADRDGVRHGAVAVRAGR